MIHEFGLYSIYIPIWFYSNSKLIKISSYRSFIYIPIWFYSNPNASAISFPTNQFTFQYGSTQIFSEVVNEDNKIGFTFQYGSTQMVTVAFMELLVS